MAFDPELDEVKPPRLSCKPTTITTGGYTVVSGVGMGRYKRFTVKVGSGNFVGTTNNIGEFSQTIQIAAAVSGQQVVNCTSYNTDGSKHAFAQTTCQVNAVGTTPAPPPPPPLPAGTAISANPTTINSGGTTTITGQSFPASSAVTISVVSGNFTVTSSASGAFTTPITITTSSSGPQTVTATSGAVSATTTVQVTVPPPPPPPPPAPTPPPYGSWTAQWYSDITLTNLVATSTVAPGPLNYNWGLGGPPELNGQVDGWSARFTNTWTYPAQSHTAKVTTDDGARLYWDGTLLIDKWFDQSPTTYYSAPFTPTAAAHTTVVEYFESGGPGQLFSDVDLTSTINPPPPPPPGAQSPGTPVLKAGPARTGHYQMTPGETLIGGTIDAQGGSRALTVADNCTVDGVEIYGCGNTGAENVFIDGSNVNLHDCFIRNSVGAGINANRAGDPNGLKNVTVNNCLIQDCGWDGFHIKGTNDGAGKTTTQKAMTFTVINCKAIRCDTDPNSSGFPFEWQDGCQDCYYSNNWSDRPFSIVGQERCKVLNNTCVGNRNIGFEFGNMYNSTWDGNISDGNDVGIIFTGMPSLSPYPGTNVGNTLSNNQLRNCAGAGIQTGTGNTNTFTDNCFFNTPTQYRTASDNSYDASRDVHTNDHVCPS